jgi:basic membrane lipoprotein Med (substrate-binding protein (PBP1-ABC) superfamily)
VSYLMVGQAPPEKDAPPNLAGIIFPEAQAGLWAGGLAAHFSEAKLVGGIFASRDIPSVGEYARGFELGANNERDESAVQAEVIAYPEGRFAASLSDIDWGENQSVSLYGRGVDVLFAYGGGTGISALEQFRGRVIGVEVDFGRRFPSMQERLVASIVFDLSILKEIGAQGKIDQPIYQGSYLVLWGNTPAPEVLELLGEISEYDALPVDAVPDDAGPVIEPPEGKSEE